MKYLPVIPLPKNAYNAPQGVDPVLNMRIAKGEIFYISIIYTSLTANPPLTITGTDNETLEIYIQPGIYRMTASFEIRSFSLDTNANGGAITVWRERNINLPEDC